MEIRGNSLLVDFKSQDSRSFVNVVLLWDQSPQPLTLQEERISVPATDTLDLPYLPCTLVVLGHVIEK